jgi:hypothetical protein
MLIPGVADDGQILFRNDSCSTLLVGSASCAHTRLIVAANRKIAASDETVLLSTVPRALKADDDLAHEVTACHELESIGRLLEFEYAIDQRVYLMFADECVHCFKVFT